MDASDLTVWEEILAVVDEADRPLSPSDLASMMPEADPGYIRKELRRLVGNGRLVQPRRGLYQTPTSEQNVDYTSREVHNAPTAPPGDRVITGSITDMLDDPERSQGNPYAGLVQVGQHIVTEMRDEAGVAFALRVSLLARPEPRRMDLSTRVETADAPPPTGGSGPA